MQNGYGFFKSLNFKAYHKSTNTMHVCNCLNAFLMVISNSHNHFGIFETFVNLSPSSAYACCLEVYQVARTLSKPYPNHLNTFLMVIPNIVLNL